jgi:hypothetical protein
VKKGDPGLSAADAADAKHTVRYMASFPGQPTNPPRGAGLETNWTLFSGTQLVVGEWK